MTGPFDIEPTASPEAWTAHLAAELALCLKGRVWVRVKHDEGDTWSLGGELIHCSTLRSLYLRGWLQRFQRDDVIGAHLTDEGRTAISQLPSPQI